MLQDVCNDCYDNGFKDGRLNAVLEVSEIVKYELHKFLLNRDVIYVDDVISILEQVKQNVICEESQHEKDQCRGS